MQHPQRNNPAEKPGLKVWVDEKAIRAAHARVITHQSMDVRPASLRSKFVQSQALCALRGFRLYWGFGVHISVVFRVDTIKSFHGVENDPDYVITPQVPGRLLNRLSGRMSSACN